MGRVEVLRVWVFLLESHDSWERTDTFLDKKQMQLMQTESKESRCGTTMPEGGNRQNTTHLEMKTKMALLLRLYLTKMDVDVQPLLHGSAFL